VFSCTLPSIEYGNQLQALQMAGEFSKWMILVQAGLLGAYARWLTTGSISPSKVAKGLTFFGFGGALVLASLRLGFLSDMAQRLDSRVPISELAVSYLLPDIKMIMLAVPQHILFFVGIVGFAWSTWSLTRNKDAKGGFGETSGSAPLGPPPPRP